jgi:DNA-binding CsgD family transcriptional regulator
MNTNGMMMNHRSMKLSSSNEGFELTRMEVSCLRLTANGLRPSEICDALDTTKADVEIHLSSAEQKLGARNRLHAVGIAVSQGLIGIDGK